MLAVLSSMLWSRVVHLDLKSSNVLLAADGTAKISDVGLSAQMVQSYLTQTAPAGTWAWVAPEVILGGDLQHMLIITYGQTYVTLIVDMLRAPSCQ